MRLSRWEKKRERRSTEAGGVYRMFDIPMGKLVKQWQEEMRRYQISLAPPLQHVTQLQRAPTGCCGLPGTQANWISLSGSGAQFWLEGQLEKRHICIHPPDQKCNTNTHTRTYCTARHVMLFSGRWTIARPHAHCATVKSSCLSCWSIRPIRLTW